MFGNTPDNFKCLHGALRVSDLESAPSLSSSLESFDHPEILVNAVNSFSKKSYFETKNAKQMHFLTRYTQKSSSLFHRLNGLFGGCSRLRFYRLKLYLPTSTHG